MTGEPVADNLYVLESVERRYERGYGWMFSRHIKQANEGCDFDFLETEFGKPVGEPSIY